MQEKKNKFKKIIGELIKKHRVKSNKSMSLLASEISISKSILYEIENGNRDPQISTIWKICEGLSIPLSELIKEIEDSLGDYYFWE